ncbi:MAG: hypothetical protein AAFO94_20630, partial [Bacteroidota bacterium]
MIISDTLASQSKRSRLITGSVLALLAVLFLFLFSRSKVGKRIFLDYQEPDLPEYVILCDAEKVEGDQFVTNGYTFSNGQRQSSEQSYSGNYSCKLAEGDGMQFGITYHLKKYEPGDLFKLSVWRLSPSGGRGILAVSDNQQFYQEEDYASSKNEKGWEKIEYFITAPDSDKPLNIYVYSGGNTTIYFDDLRIEKIVEENVYQAEKLNLEI